MNIDTSYLQSSPEYLFDQETKRGKERLKSFINVTLPRTLPFVLSDYLKGMLCDVFAISKYFYLSECGSVFCFYIISFSYHGISILKHYLQKKEEIASNKN